jgi:hypothetical protein
VIYVLLGSTLMLWSKQHAHTALPVRLQGQIQVQHGAQSVNPASMPKALRIFAKSALLESIVLQIV